MKAVNLTILAGDEMTCQDAGQGRDRSKTPSPACLSAAIEVHWTLLACAAANSSDC